MPTIQLQNKTSMWVGQMTAKFIDLDGYGRYIPAREVKTCVLNAGISPAHAFLSISVKNLGAGAWSETAPTVALRQDGPAGNIKLLARTEVSYTENGNTHTLLSGWLVSHLHLLHEDAVAPELYDDRLSLDRVKVHGRLIYDPQSQIFYWDSALKTIFNDLGFPNCIDSPIGPVFAPGWLYGYRAEVDGSDTTEPARGARTSRAGSWYGADAMDYFALVHSARKRGIIPPVPKEFGNTLLTSYINWPDNIGQAFTSARKLSMDGGFVVDDMTLLEAVHAVLKKQGAYDMDFLPLGNFNSQLKILNMNPDFAYADELHLQSYGPYTIQECATNPAIVKEGYAAERATDYRHGNRIIGKPPSVEMMLSMFCSKTMQGFQWALEPAWDVLDEFALKQYVATYRATRDAAVAEAFAKWPLVYASYRIRLAFNPWTGTKYDGRVPIGRQRFKPFLNTWINGGGQNPSHCMPRQIVVEFFNIAAGDDAKWTRASEFNNLNLLFGDTVCEFSSLRAQNQTWYSKPFTGMGVEPDDWYGNNMYSLPIRFTAAIEAPWCIYGFDDKDPNATAARVEQQLNWTSSMRAADGDYEERLRRGDAAPLGGVIATQFLLWPAHCTANDELFSDAAGPAGNPNADSRIMVHASQKNAGEKLVEPNAGLRIAMIAPAYRPGQPKIVKGKNTVPYRGVLRTVTFSSVGHSMQDSADKAPDTWLSLGKPDYAVAGGTVQNVQGGPGFGDTGYNDTGKKKDDTYNEEHKQKIDTDTGGGGRTQDEYEKAEAAKNAPAQQPAAKQDTTTKAPAPVRSNDAGERKIAGQDARASKANNRLANMKDEYAKMDANDTKGRAALEKKMRGEEKKGENATRKSGDMRERDAGRKGGHEAFLGKPNSGTINGKGSIADALLGKAGHGRMTPGGKGATHREWDTNTTAGKAMDSAEPFGKFSGHTWDSRNPQQPSAAPDWTAGAAAAEAQGKSGEQPQNSAAPKDPLVAQMKQQLQAAQSQKAPSKQVVFPTANQGTRPEPSKAELATDGE